MKLVFVLQVIYSIFLELYVLSFFSSIQSENKCEKIFFTFLTCIMMMNRIQTSKVTVKIIWQHIVTESNKNLAFSISIMSSNFKTPNSKYRAFTEKRLGQNKLARKKRF